MKQEWIHVKGAREHNLKNISVSIPRNKLVVITGLSGSGKSSLAFDTLYAEGQRRYVESLSAYARQFIQLSDKPDVDSIEGLSPAISIEQKTTSKNPRSTVGTITEIYDYLRLLFARIGTPFSPATGKPIQSQTISQMVDITLSLPEKTKVLLLAPIVRGRKGEYKKELATLQKEGFSRFSIDGHMYEAPDLPTLEKNKKHTISVVVDRLVIVKGLEERLADSFETALRLSQGLAIIEELETKKQTLFSEKFACPVSGFTLEEIEPRLFSFNSPFGACSACDGLGVRIVFDIHRILPHPNKPLHKGALAVPPWNTITAEWYRQALTSLLQHFNCCIDTPYNQLPEQVQKAILYGTGSTPIAMSYEGVRSTYTTHKPFEGIIPNLERRFKETESTRTREDLAQYQTTLTCTECHGFRLKPDALCVKIDGKHIGEICSLSIKDCLHFFTTLTLADHQVAIGQRILKEIIERLSFLESVGIGYLALSRRSGTLSGGESQRIRLASQIGSGLTGVLYVLDEPSIGLHQRDNDKLIQTLLRLKNLGNTVVVVEHDEDTIRSCDHVIDMGPGAGTFGGKVQAQGTPQDIMATKDSLTGAYLRYEKCISIPEHRRSSTKGHLSISNVSTHNLKNITVQFPLGVLTCITGVSGSGKSSLIFESLYPCLQAGTVEGQEHIDKVIHINQAPIGKTPRSNPATYTGVFDPIRDWFATLPKAKARGYTKGRFSFNVKGGRCEACQGDGVIKIEMHFLPDVHVICDQCKGKRYNRETLEITHKGKNIADILNLSVDEALIFFDAVPSIRNKLSTLKQVGLGYMSIGQRATTLSGGEAQRIKLSKELSKKSTGRTLYILDEPTTGLHIHDTRELLDVLHALVKHGNTMIIIEHNLDVIKTADWIIDMGPEGGDEGGYVVDIGTPEDIMARGKSITGKYLAKHITQQKHTSI